MRNTAAALAFVAPNAVMYALFVITPAGAGIVLGFFKWDLFGSPRWSGVDNYKRLAHDPQLLNALGNSLEYLALGVIPTVLGGFMVAVLINSRMRGVAAVRTAYFVPLVVSSSVSAVLWSYLYQPDVGMVNRALGLLGITGPAWLSNTTYALPALTVTLIWLSLPIVAILYLAALQRIPEEIYDAASIDGAGVWTRLWQITWPNVTAMTMLVFVLEILDFLSSPVQISLIMTHGGPLDSTEPLSLYVYKLAFEQSDVGYAACVSTFQFLIVILLGLVLRSTGALRWSRG